MDFDTTSINEKVYKLLRERIIFGDYAPGSRIEIKGISQELDVSSQPVKEAIFRLAGERFITIVARKGTFVRQASLKDLANMVEARILYETGAIELSKGQVRGKDFEGLRAVCENFLINENTTYKEMQKKNMAFHCAVVSLAKNQWLDQAYGLLMDHYACLHYSYVVKGKDYADKKQIYEDHSLVVDALEQRDFEKAKQTTKIHMQRVKDKIEAVLFSKTPAKEGQNVAKKNIT